MTMAMIRGLYERVESMSDQRGARRTQNTILVKLTHLVDGVMLLTENVSDHKRSNRVSSPQRTD
jgi:hypothetical protein